MRIRGVWMRGGEQWVAALEIVAKGATIGQMAIPLEKGDAAAILLGASRFVRVPDQFVRRRLLIWRAIASNTSPMLSPSAAKKCEGEEAHSRICCSGRPGASNAMV